MTKMTLSEAQRRLPELVAAAELGEAVEIRAENGRTYRLVPWPPAAPETSEARADWPGYPKAGSCKGMIWMAEDFDAPLEELHEYME